MPDPFANFWLLLFGTITVITVVSVIAGTGAHLRHASAEYHLKMQMIQRGMSAEEIERVLSCNSGRPPRPPSGPTGIDEDSLNEMVAVLAENGASAQVIEQVLTAFRSVDAATQRLVSEAVQHLLGHGEGVGDEQILAVVRPLCLPKDPPATVPFNRSEAFHA